MYEYVEDALSRSVAKAISGMLTMGGRRGHHPEKKGGRPWLEEGSRGAKYGIAIRKRGGGDNVRGLGLQSLSLWSDLEPLPGKKREGDRDLDCTYR